MATFLEELAAASDLQHVVTDTLFSSVPYLFADDRALWSSWKSTLALGLDVDPHSVLLVGSSAVGVSLNPNKVFRPFDATSDIDVAVISTRHFEEAWHTLRSLGVRMLGLSRRVQTEIRQYAPNYVYWGVIATDRLLGVLDFGPSWQEALASMRQAEPTRDRRIRVRLYRDIGALRTYQLRALREARASLDDPEDT
ncbi:MAG TPA: hypothetical protein VGO48_11400 [Conexibacter sp.]|jgi:hypothetical protein|nr:hypothetical protein [Conexibacter sp.]